MENGYAVFMDMETSVHNFPFTCRNRASHRYKMDYIIEPAISYNNGNVSY